MASKSGVTTENYKTRRYYKRSGKFEGEEGEVDIIKMATSNAQRYAHLPDFNPNETDDEIREKLEERFLVLGHMARECIDNNVTALIVSGPGGVGKTYTIDEELDAWDPEGEKFTRSSGYMRATGLFKRLYRHRAKGDILVLDDMDSIFYDDISLNFLKTALDTTQRRILTYGAETTLVDEETMETVPRVFEYEGTVIFITNLDFDILIDKGTKLAPHLEALITRSHYIDLMMKTKRDYLIHVFEVAEKGLFDSLNLTEDEQYDVLDFVGKHHKILRECSLRMALKVAKLRKVATDEDKVRWDRLALLTCCRGVR